VKKFLLEYFAGLFSLPLHSSSAFPISQLLALRSYTPRQRYHTERLFIQSLHFAHPICIPPILYLYARTITTNNHDQHSKSYHSATLFINICMTLFFYFKILGLRITYRGFLHGCSSLWVGVFFMIYCLKLIPSCISAFLGLSMYVYQMLDSSFIEFRLKIFVFAKKIPS